VRGTSCHCGRRYRYYVSAALITEAGTDRAQGWRLAASEIEETVIRILANPQTVAKVRSFSHTAPGFSAETGWLLEERRFACRVLP